MSLPPYIRIGLIFLIGTILVLGLFFSYIPTRPADPQALAFNEVAEMVKNGSVRKITARKSDLQIEFLNGKRLSARKDASAGLTEQLRDYGVTQAQLEAITVSYVAPAGSWSDYLVRLVIPVLSLGTLLRIMFVLQRSQAELKAVRLEIAAFRAEPIAHPGAGA